MNAAPSKRRPVTSVCVSSKNTSSSPSAAHRASRALGQQPAQELARHTPQGRHSRLAELGQPGAHLVVRIPPPDRSAAPCPGVAPTPARRGTDPTGRGAVRSPPPHLPAVDAVALGRDHFNAQPVFVKVCKNL